MKKTLSALFTLSMLIFSMAFGGCANESFVYQRSVSELNQKAAELMEKGDYAGAVGRLESAHDLMPKESSILFNLAVAYQKNDQLDKSIQAFEQFIQMFENDPKINDAVFSLAIVLEGKADKLAKEAIKADSEKEIEVRNALIDESINYYERAEKAYRIMQSRFKKGQVEDARNFEEVEQQLKAIEETLMSLKEGHLEKITLF